MIFFASPLVAPGVTLPSETAAHITRNKRPRGLAIPPASQCNTYIQFTAHVLTADRRNVVVTSVNGVGSHIRALLSDYES